MVKIPNITGLRFFLAICVVIFHTSEFCSKHNIPFYNNLPIFNKGHEAVCVFFSLSGFLIIRQLYLEKESFSNISLKKFYWRRILRIFPLYFFILSYGFLHYQFILPTFNFAGEYNNNYNLIEGILLSVFFLPNVFSSLYSPGGIIEILWSIGVEEQFYLFIAPILMFVPLKKHFLMLLFLTVIFFIFNFYLENSFLNRFGMLFFYFTFSGMASIIMLKSKRILSNKIVSYILITLFLCYFFTDFFVELLSNTSYNFFSMILFGLFIGSLSYYSYPPLNNTWITYLGKISYGIYMFHAIVVQATGFVYLKLFLPLELNYSLVVILYNIMVIIITITISHFSYKYYESFFIRKYKKLN